MEDTGWYLPVYAMAEPLKWGKGLGCDFALKSCKEWMDTRTRENKSIHPYCNKVHKFHPFCNKVHTTIHPYCDKVDKTIHHYCNNVQKIIHPHVTRYT